MTNNQSTSRIFITGVAVGIVANNLFYYIIKKVGYQLYNRDLYLEFKSCISHLDRAQQPVPESAKPAENSLHEKIEQAPYTTGINLEDFTLNVNTATPIENPLSHDIGVFNSYNYAFRGISSPVSYRRTECPDSVTGLNDSDMEITSYEENILKEDIRDTPTNAIMLIADVKQNI